MIQQNEQIQHHCDNEVLRAILGCPTFYMLPNPYNEDWESIPIDSSELNERMSLLRDAQSAKQRDMEREPHHFMTTLLNTQVFEDLLPHYKDIKNENIVKNCKDILVKEATVRLAEVKVALICQYLRFMKNALNAYSEIVKTYNELPKKTHITQDQDIVDEELTAKLVIEMMNQVALEPALEDTDEPKKNNVEMTYPILNMAKKEELTTKLVKVLTKQEPEDVDSPITNDTKIQHPTVNMAKKMGIPFKELKKNYPIYRSKFNTDTQFTYCIWTYSYYFFTNNFSYEKKEEGAVFAYSAMEYIKHLVHGTIYNPPTESTYRNILDGIAELKQASPYQFRYQDTIQCDFIMNDTTNNIGFYFSKSNDSYLEKTDITS